MPTSVALSSHFEAFVKDQVSTGRFNTSLTRRWKSSKMYSLPTHEIQTETLPMQRWMLSLVLQIRQRRLGQMLLQCVESLLRHAGLQMAL